MEAIKKLQKLSLAALIVSLLPLATLVPVFLKSPCRMVCVQFGRSATLSLYCRAFCSP